MHTDRLERSKKPGVHYALTRDGLELPLVDVTHPAFALDLSAEEQRGLVDRFMRETESLLRLPAFVRNAILRLALRKSALAPGIRRARGTYMSGVSTYLLKLGPDNLGEAYAAPIDRKIAASVPVLAVRLRLQDVAHLLAGALRSRLAAAPGAPLRIFDIAGGTAIDAINALLLLAREGALAGRRVRIDVLDLDTDGPAFGGRGLEALRGEGAPLAGLDVALRPTRYDWSDPSPLRELLRGAGGTEGITAGSSEGGLFEYGTDEAITANLVCLREHAPRDFALAGSVTRADAVTRRLYQTNGASARPRGLEAFRALVARAGWRVTQAIERPFSDQVLLERAP